LSTPIAEEMQGRVKTLKSMWYGIKPHKIQRAKP
jgi:hypothetical protein